MIRHVCVRSATATDHKNHNTVPIEEESEEKKVEVTKTAFKRLI